MPPRNSLKQSLPSSTSRTQTETMEAVKNILTDIPLVTFRQLALYPFGVDDDRLVLWVEAKAHTWSRSARRKNKRLLLPTLQIPLLDPPLQCIIRTDVDKVEMDWIRGCSPDRVVFEGFWGYVSRKAVESLVTV